MKKMGYEAGKGLGKFEQGMINPLDVKFRVNRSGLGWEKKKGAKIKDIEKARCAVR